MHVMISRLNSNQLSLSNPLSSPLSLPLPPTHTHSLSLTLTHILPIQCGGVTEHGSKFYTNEGYKLSSSSGSTVYIKGGEDQSKLETVSVPKYGYTWTQTSTYRYINQNGNWNNLDDAYKYCVAHKNCHGITRRVSHHHTKENISCNPV